MDTSSLDQSSPVETISRLENLIANLKVKLEEDYRAGDEQTAGHHAQLITKYSKMLRECVQCHEAQEQLKVRDTICSKIHDTRQRVHELSMDMANLKASILRSFSISGFPDQVRTQYVATVKKCQELMLRQCLACDEIDIPSEVEGATELKTMRKDVVHAIQNHLHLLDNLELYLKSMESFVSFVTHDMAHYESGANNNNTNNSNHTSSQHGDQYSQNNNHNNNGNSNSMDHDSYQNNHRRSSGMQSANQSRAQGGGRAGTPSRTHTPY